MVYGDRPVATCKPQTKKCTADVCLIVGSTAFAAPLLLSLPHVPCIPFAAEHMFHAPRYAARSRFWSAFSWIAARFMSYSEQHWTWTWPGELNLGRSVLCGTDCIGGWVPGPLGPLLVLSFHILMRLFCVCVFVFPSVFELCFSPIVSLSACLCCLFFPFV